MGVMRVETYVRPCDAWMDGWMDIMWGVRVTCRRGMAQVVVGPIERTAMRERATTLMMAVQAVPVGPV